jgi:transcription elongation factor/antiterminator RfaH
MAPGSRSALWYAIYTRSRNEKKVAALLERDSIEVYLPLLKTLKRWSDRRKMVEEPLFKSYLFVKIEEKDHLTVLNTPGVVRYVTFEGKKVVVRPASIAAIKEYLGSEEILTPLNEADYTPGKKVKIVKGSMKGLEGRLVMVMGKQRVRVEIEAVNKSVFIAIPKSFLEITGESTEDEAVRYW